MSVSWRMMCTQWTRFATKPMVHARYLANVIARKLDTKTRCIELATLQRCAGHLTSRTDITEAYQVGGAAAKAAFEGVTRQMVALSACPTTPTSAPPSCTPSAK